MRSITQVTNASRIENSSSSIQLFRVIGSVDMDGHGHPHEPIHIDPFIFLDDAMIEGELSSSFNKHPHAGLTAVTYLLEGTAHAWDNIYGETPDLNRAGGIYVVDTGQGVVHGEAPITGVRKLRLLQMWFNPNIYDVPLPAASYQLFQPDVLPVYEDDKIWAKIIMGLGFNATSPVSSRWPIQYLHIRLAAQATYSIEIPHATWHGFIYIIQGKGRFGSNQVIGTMQQCLTIGHEPTTSIQIENMNHEPLEFVFATGQPHHKPFVKLLGHGGAIVADTAQHARALMKKYEMNPDFFGAASS